MTDVATKSGSHRQSSTHHHPYVSPINRSPLPTLREILRVLRNGLGMILLRAFLLSLRKRSITRFLSEIRSVYGLRWASLIMGISSYRFLSRGLSSPVCGLLCGLPIATLDLPTRTEITMYLLARCVHGFVLNSVNPLIPPPIAMFEHYDTLAMSGTAMWLLYAYVYHPRTVAPSYYNFLTVCSRVDWRTTVGICKLYSEKIISEEAVTLCWKNKVPVPPTADPKYICQSMLHPGVPCLKHCFSYIPLHMKDFGMPLYLPLKVSTTVMFSPKDVMKRPLRTMKKVIKSALQSSLFLACYCSVPVVGGCILSNCFANHHYLIVGSAVTILAGLMTVIEPKSRRLDLALFCVMHALRSMLGVLVTRRLLPRPTSNRITLLFCGCLAYTFHLVKTQRVHPHIATFIHAL